MFLYIIFYGNPNKLNNYFEVKRNDFKYFINWIKFNYDFYGFLINALL